MTQLFMDGPLAAATAFPVSSCVVGVGIIMGRLVSMTTASGPFSSEWMRILGSRGPELRLSIACCGIGSKEQRECNAPPKSMKYRISGISLLINPCWWIDRSKILTLLGSRVGTPELPLGTFRGRLHAPLVFWAYAGFCDLLHLEGQCALSWINRCWFREA